MMNSIICEWSKKKLQSISLNYNANFKISAHSHQLTEFVIFDCITKRLIRISIGIMQQRYSRTLHITYQQNKNLQVAVLSYVDV